MKTLRLGDEEKGRLSKGPGALWQMPWHGVLQQAFVDFGAARANALRWRFEMKEGRGGVNNARFYAQEARRCFALIVSLSPRLTVSQSGSGVAA